MRHLLAGFVLVAALAQPALGQEVTAEVRTWEGQVLTLSSPTFEVFYTVVVPRQRGEGAAPGAAPGVVEVGAAGPTNGAGGAVPGYGPAVGIAVRGPRAGGEIGSQGPEWQEDCCLPLEALQGRRQLHVLTLMRGATEMRVPLSEVAALVFSRRRVVGSPLPAWEAPSHFHHAATAVLNDGSQVQADYVNLGTSILRGTSVQGTVDVPWGEIETVRFRR
jgi:hypothetical protein